MENKILPRRKFILQMGALTGAAMLPACEGCTNGKKDGCVKVKVVFAYPGDYVQTIPDWPNVGYDFRPHMEPLVNALNARIPDVQFIQAGAKNNEEAKAMVEADGDNVAGYIVVQMTTCQNHILDGIATSRKPILYTPHPFAGDGSWTQFTTKYLNDGYPYFECVASLDIKGVITVAGAFSKLNGGTAEDFTAEAGRLRRSIVPQQCKAKAVEDNLKCLTPEETLAKMKGKKILSVQRDDKELFAKLKETFGLEYRAVTFDEFNAMYAKISDSEAAGWVKKWKEKSNGIYDVKEEDMMSAAKSYLTQKALIKKYDAYAVTIDCLGGCYSGVIEGYPCLGFMQLQDEGFMGVCENDFMATTTMIAFQAMTGRTGIVSDPVLDFPNRSIIYAHCVSTTKFLGPDGPVSDYEIMTHSEDRKGASVRAFAPVGYPVTTVLLNTSRNILTIHTGVVTGNSGDDRACRTKIVAEITGDYDKMHRSWYCWHRVTFMGNFAKEAEAFGKKIGYEVIYES